MFYFIYPVLFSLLPPLFLYERNSGEIHFRDLASIAVIIASSVILLIVALAYFFDVGYMASAPITCGVVLLFYTPTAKLKRFLSRYFYQYIIEYSVYFLLLYTVVKFPFFFTAILDVLSILLTTLIIISIITKRVANLKTVPTQTDANDYDRADAQFTNEDKPDVYNILFDAYIGLQALKKTTGFDNAEFYDELRKRGFFLPEKAYANYNHTSASVPSFLNMEYTENYLAKTDFESEQFKNDNQRYRLAHMISGNVPRVFKKYGYQYIITGEPLLDNDILSKNASFIDGYADRAQNLIKNSTLLTFFNMTIIGRFFQNENAMKNHADYIYRIMSAIPELVDKPSPKFSFFHIWAPHTPYVFNEDGTINQKFSTLNDLTSEDDETKQAYVGNLKFINKIILKTIDHTIEKIKNKNKKSIILIHGDHGLFKSSEISSEFNILFAAYGYKLDINDVFPNKISLVNTYRYLFNKIFCCSYPILKNKFIYENWFSGDYNEKDVTGKIMDMSDDK